MLVVGPKSQLKLDAVAFLADGRIAAVTHTGLIQFHDPADPAASPVAPPPLPAALEPAVGRTAVAVAADPEFPIAYKTGEWYGLLGCDAASGTAVPTPERCRMFAFAPDGRRATTTRDDGDGAVLEMWDVTPGRAWTRAWSERFDHATLGPRAIAPDGRVVFCYKPGPWYDGSPVEIRGRGPAGDPAGFSPAYGDAGGFVPGYQLVDQILPHPSRDVFLIRSGMAFVVYDFTDPLEPRVCKITNTNRKHFTGIAFHPSGNVLAAAANDKTIKLYDANTWKLTGTFEWKSGRMRSVAYNRDGTLCAAGTDRGPGGRQPEAGRPTPAGHPEAGVRGQARPARPGRRTRRGAARPHPYGADRDELEA